MTKHISNSEQDTIKIAQSIAKDAKRGDVFLLYGTLGVGKSVFSRAFIRALCGQNTEVPSPTFTILQTYDAKDAEIYHFDLYRIKSEEELFELGIEDALYAGICLIEWATKMGRYLPKKHTKIDISQQNDTRTIHITKSS